MKKLRRIALAVLVGFGLTIATPMFSDSNVAHAAFYKCLKCGRGTSATTRSKMSARRISRMASPIIKFSYSF